MPETQKPKNAENEEAYIGKRGEEILINILKSRRDVVECIEKLAGRSIGNMVEVVRGKCFGLWKTDVVLIGFAGIRTGISLKTFKASGRPDVHLDRRWLDMPSKRAKPWLTVLCMPQNIVNILRNGILNKAMASNPQAPLVPDPRHQDMVRNFLLQVIRKFLEEAFRNGEQDLQALALLEYNSQPRLCLFNLDDVIVFIEDNVRKKGITFGSRINIGDFIQWQRKAGNGSRVKIPKTHPRHPGNQLQVKFMARNFMHEAVKQINKQIRGCCYDLLMLQMRPAQGP